jgi:hypothetical protein
MIIAQRTGNVVLKQNIARYFQGDDKLKFTRPANAQAGQLFEMLLPAFQQGAGALDLAAVDQWLSQQSADPYDRLPFHYYLAESLHALGQVEQAKTYFEKCALPWRMDVWEFHTLAWSSMRNKGIDPVPAMQRNKS